MEFENDFSSESSFVGGRERLSEGLTGDQRVAWELLNSSGNVFVTGGAGSGKSFVLRRYMALKDPKKFPVLASTGAAAVLVGGRTFHSFMGLGIMEGGVDATVVRALEDRRVKKRLRAAEGFVVDEVSMLSGPTLAAAERICQIARESLEPWGGLRVVAVGDFAQLPPVQQGGENRAWAFLDAVWERSEFKSIFLKENVRTENQQFLEILGDVRRGDLTPRVKTFLEDKKRDYSHGKEGTRLFPRRHQTDKFNLEQLEKLNGQVYSFEATYSGQARFVAQLKKNSPLSEELLLKEGAFVMLRQNDPRQRWVNGSSGYVRKIEGTKVSVELLQGRTVTVEPVTLSMLNAEGVPVASVTNLPLSLAYAATIHKAQGLTLDRMTANLTALWEPGQAYVAMSRIMDPAQLQVQDWDARSFRADPSVESFYQGL